MSVILLATNNPHKVSELRAMARPLELRILAPSEIGLDLEVDEVGASFAENALLKANAFHLASGYPTLADDSGLVIDALGGEPGIYSARYGGEGLDDQDRVRLVLKRMNGVPDGKRGARFVAAIALAVGGQPPCCFTGTVQGRITREPRGANGFGYDPIFFYPPFGCTLAEVSAAQKATVSHRGHAMRQAIDFIRTQMSDGILSQQ